MEEENEEVLMFLRRSRKGYLIEYGCVLFLLLLLAIIRLRGVVVAAPVTYIVGGIVLVSLVSAEYSRILTSYKIMETKIIISHGLVQRMKRNVHFVPLGFVPEINMKQNRIQRFLNFGTIFVHGTGENSFEIKDVNNPQRILTLIEELIEKNRMGRPAKGQM